MAYSSVAQLRRNLTLADVNRIDDSAVQDRIDHSDDDIEMDLGKYIDFSNATLVSGYTNTNFPAWLNHLSQFKTCEHVLIKLYGAKRQGDDVSDIQYWNSEYDKLLKKIITNQIQLVLVDGTSVSRGQFTIRTGKSGTAPILGMGPYGTFEDNDDLEDDRPLQ